MKDNFKVAGCSSGLKADAACWCQNNHGFKSNICPRYLKIDSNFQRSFSNPKAERAPHTKNIGSFAMHDASCNLQQTLFLPPLPLCSSN